MQTISKLEAADLLLDSAVRRLLDDQDYVGAIVLAGAAEDVLQGLLLRDGRLKDAARSQMNVHIKRFLSTIDPEATVSDRDAYSMQRLVYNWLRHNDADDLQTLNADLFDEALMVLHRAIENRGMLDGTAHPRTNEVLELSQDRC